MRWDLIGSFSLFAFMVSCGPEASTRKHQQVEQAKPQPPKDLTETEVKSVRPEEPKPSPQAEAKVEVDFDLVEVPYRVSLSSLQATAEYARTGSQTFRISRRKSTMPPQDLYEFETATKFVEASRESLEPGLTQPLREITFDYSHVWLKFDFKNVVLSVQEFSDRAPGYRIYRSAGTVGGSYQLFYSPQREHCRLVYSDTTPNLNDLKRPQQTFTRDYPHIPCVFHSEAEPWIGPSIFDRGSVKAGEIAWGKSASERKVDGQKTELSARILERSVRVIKLQLDRKHTLNEERSWSHSLDHILGGEIFQSVGNPFTLELDPSHPEFSATMLIYRPTVKSSVHIIVRWSLESQIATLEIANHPDFSDTVVVLQGGEIGL